MFEEVFKVGIVNARYDAGTDGDGHVPVLLLERREDFANLCNDLLHSGIRLLRLTFSNIEVKLNFPKTKCTHLQIVKIIHNLLVVHVQVIQS